MRRRPASQFRREHPSSEPPSQSSLVSSMNAQRLRGIQRAVEQASIRPQPFSNSITAINFLFVVCRSVSMLLHPTRACLSCLAAARPLPARSSDGFLCHKSHLSHCANLNSQRAPTRRYRHQLVARFAAPNCEPLLCSIFHKASLNVLILFI